MNKIICFFVLCLAVFPVTENKACGSAYHYRSFPAGICTEGLVMIEMGIYRGPDGVQFTLTGELVVYDQQHQVKNIKLIDSLHLDSFLLEPVRKLYLKGLHMAKTKKNMQWAVPTDIYFCGFHDTCDAAKIITDSLSRDSLELPSGKRYRIISREKPEPADEGEPWDGTYPVSIAMRGPHISSFRTYKTGKQKLYIAHIGTGDPDWDTGVFYYPYEAHKPDMKFEKLETSFYMEEMLGHGEGFDFFVLE